MLFIYSDVPVFSFYFQSVGLLAWLPLSLLTCIPAAPSFFIVADQQLQCFTVSIAPQSHHQNWVVPHRPSSPFSPAMPGKSSKKVPPVVRASRRIAGLLPIDSVRPPTRRLAGLHPADSVRPSQPATHTVNSSNHGESSFPHSIIKFSHAPSHSRFQYRCCRQAARCV
jgi:hypothetical protein